MRTFNTIVSLKSFIKDAKRQSFSVGLVPTMGALHEGHAELIKSSTFENEVTICSVFVNPAQFNNPQDLDNYPRTLEADLQFLDKLGCSAVFSPAVQEIYNREMSLKFDLGHIGEKLEGKHRPGHFNGVALIVSKLFNIVNPDRAYFGQKDLQQFKIIDLLVKDLSFGIELKCTPIVRDKNGLALSSRNMRLTNDGLKKAALLNQVLVESENYLVNGKSINEVVSDADQLLNENDITLEYLELVDLETFESVKNKSDNNSVALCIAAYVEGIRLIDNRIF